MFRFIIGLLGWALALSLSHTLSGQIKLEIPIADSLYKQGNSLRPNDYSHSSQECYQYLMNLRLIQCEYHKKTKGSDNLERHANSYLRSVNHLGYRLFAEGKVLQVLALVDTGLQFYKYANLPPDTTTIGLVRLKALIFYSINNRRESFKQYALAMTMFYALSLIRSLNPTEYSLITRLIKETGWLYNADYYESKTEAISFILIAKDRLSHQLTTALDTLLLIEVNLELVKNNFIFTKEERNKQLLLEIVQIARDYIGLETNHAKLIQEKLILAYIYLSYYSHDNLENGLEYCRLGDRLATSLYATGYESWSSLRRCYALKSTLARIFMRQGKYRKAIEKLNTPIPFFKDRDNHPLETASNYSGLSEAYLLLGQLDSSEYFARNAIQEYEKMGDKDNIHIKHSFKQLAKIQLRQGCYREALESIEIPLSLFSIDSNGIALQDNYDLSLIELQHKKRYIIEFLHIKAQILACQKDDRNMKYALNLYRNCLIWGDRLLEGMSPYFESRPFIEYLKNVSSDAMGLALRLRDEESAFFFAEKGNAILSRQFFQVLNEAQDSGVPDSLLKKTVHLLAKMYFYGKQIDYDSNINFLNCKKEYDTLQTFIQKSYPASQEQQNNFSITTPLQICRSLNKRSYPTAMIEYICTDSLIYQMIFTSKTFHILSISIKKDTLEKLIQCFRQSLCHPITKRTNFAAYKKTGEQLYQLLIAPAESLFDIHQQPCKQLIIIPDGQLHYLSFQGLIRPSPTTSSERPAYLALDYAISHTSSASLWMQEQITHQAIEQPGGLLSLVGCFQSEETIKLKLNTTDIHPLIKAYGATSSTIQPFGSLLDSLNTVRGKVLSPLNYAFPQAFFCDRLFEKRNLPHICLQDSKNTKERLIHYIENNQYNIIQLITHGTVHPNDPFRTCIYLYDMPKHHRRDSLMALEVMSLRTKARLVVFSACETGIDQIYSGEGMEGLVQSWRFAGARNILASLGEINDRATAVFMIYFCRVLLEEPQTPLPFILQKTQKYMIHSNLFNEPVFWANLKLIGSE